MNFEMLNDKPEGTIIKVIGVGGAGGNAVQHMITRGVSGVEFICANTDAQALKHATARNKLQLGASGLGAGAKPEIARAAAEENRDRIADLIRDANMVFITAGMGGGTGTGAAPVIAEIAKQMGILTVAVVSKPFSYEGAKRMKIAEEGLALLEANVDSLIVVLNDKLEEIMGDDVAMDEAFHAADDVLNNAVAGIAEIITVDGHINVDFNDVKTVMGEQGRAMMGSAIASGRDRARTAAHEAIASPLLDGVDLASARGILINISASRETLKARETREVVTIIRDSAAEETTLIYGFVYDESLGEQLRVTVVATGLGGANKTDGDGSGIRVTAADTQAALVAEQAALAAQQREATQMLADHAAQQAAAQAAEAQAFAAQPAAVEPSYAPVQQAPAVDPRRGMVQTFGHYDELSEPTYLRRQREQASPRVVNGEEFTDLDVPAFLRRQAD